MFGNADNTKHAFHNQVLLTHEGWLCYSGHESWLFLVVLLHVGLGKPVYCDNWHKYFFMMPGCTSHTMCSEDWKHMFTVQLAMFPLFPSCRPNDVSWTSIVRFSHQTSCPTHNKQSDKIQMSSMFSAKKMHSAIVHWLNAGVSALFCIDIPH